MKKTIILFSILLLLVTIRVAVPKIITSVTNRWPSHPYITGDAFRSHCDFVFDETNKKFDPKQIKTGDKIFVKTDMLEEFFANCHGEISNKYILVSHNADHEVKNYNKYLDDDKIIVWFAQNSNQYHKKLIPIPIGVENRYCAGSKLKVIDKYRLKTKIPKKKYLLYMNFNINNFPKERAYVHDLFVDESYCKKTLSIPFESFYKDIVRSNFVLCPRGNGLDCHRTWEALYVGAIPIVLSSPMDSLFEGMRVIIVDKWTDINKEFLEKKYSEMMEKEYIEEKLYIDYWLNLIDSYKNP